MKQLVEVIAKSLVENPDCCESGFFKKQQKSDCRYSAMKKRQELWIPWLLFLL